MMGPGMFDGIFEGLILAGVVIGVLLVALGAGLFWLFSHLEFSIAWI